MKYLFHRVRFQQVRNQPTVDYEPVISQRGRSRGRGKGRGRSPSSSARGKGSGRGRGGAREKRKQTGAFHLDRDEVSRLQHLKEERKRKASVSSPLSYHSNEIV